MIAIRARNYSVCRKLEKKSGLTSDLIVDQFEIEPQPARWIVRTWNSLKLVSILGAISWCTPNPEEGVSVI
jgi:hypothetical protein